MVDGAVETDLPNDTATAAEAEAVSKDAEANVVKADGGDEDDDDDLFGEDDEEKDKKADENDESEANANSTPKEDAPAAEEPKTTSPTINGSTGIPTEESSNLKEEGAEDPETKKRKIEDTTSATNAPSSSIPRKKEPTEAPSSVSYIEEGAKKPRINGSSGLDPKEFGLPESTRIPVSVTAALLRSSGGNSSKTVIDSLKTLPPNLINDALAEYDEAVTNKGQGIRNHGAYLFGVVRRYMSARDRSMKSGGTGVLPMGDNITPAVLNRLEQLVNSGFCSREEMNSNIKQKIRMLSEGDALSAVEDLARVNRASIRNFGFYFAGIVNRYMRGEAEKSQQKSLRVAAAASSHHHSSQSSSNNHSARAPHNHQNHGHYGHGGGGDRRFSRDNHMNAPSYPYQNRDGPQNHQSQYGGPPPQTQHMGYDSRQQQGWQAQPNSNMPPQQPPPSMAPYGSQPPNSMTPQQPQSYGGPPSYPPQQQQMSDPNFYAQQQQHQPMMNQAYPPSTQQPGMMLPQQNSPGQYGAPSQPPVGSGWQPQGAPAGLPVDILGLADKAASAVQALSSQSRMAPSNAGIPPQQSMQTPTYMVSQPYMGGAPPQHQPPSYPPQQQPPAGMYSNPRSAPPMQHSNRNTAQLSELPTMVQFAIRVRIATAHWSYRNKVVI